MREWEKRKGEKGSGERPINRGSVELRKCWQILGGGIEKKGQKEKREKKKEKNQKKKGKPNTNHYNLRFESNPEVKKEQFGPSEGKELL